MITIRQTIFFLLDYAYILFMLCIELFNKSFQNTRHVIKFFLWVNNSKKDVRTRVRWDVLGVLPISKGHFKILNH
jgi:hypothetical protein